MKGLLRRGNRKHAHAMLVAALVLDGAVDKGEQRIVLATTHVRTRVDVGAVLTDENRARSDGLAGEALAAKTLTARVAAITGGTKSFFMCHLLYLLSRSLELLSALGRGGSLGVLGGLAGARAW